MKIMVENLGVLRQAEFTLGDLTILCGRNNTGKTYATYALFGFLDTWRQMLSLKIDQEKIRTLVAEGVVELDLQKYIAQAETIMNEACKAYTKQLPKIFAARINRFKETTFQLTLDTTAIRLEKKFERIISSGEVSIFSIKKDEDSTILVITLLSENERVKIPLEILDIVISTAVKDTIFGAFLPRVFIASTERTGAAIFRSELNFARNRLLEEIRGTEKVDLIDLLSKEYNDYALPIEKNVDFIRQLETTVKKSSFIAQEHPDILSSFADIIGGEYVVTKNDELYYTPKNKQVRLSMDESSSAVRSLLDIGFYLKHEAQQGDLLMVDEPELNLHPENQRRIAKLFTRLVNLGIKVFISTHSDYIIKELNTLIMLKQNKPYLKRISEEEGYKTDELISPENIKVYIAEESSVRLQGMQRRTKCQTLTLAKITPDLGIEARSFDITINTMNRIQESIVWGEE